MAQPEKSRLRFFAEYWLPVLVYLTAIVFLSAQPQLKPPISFQNSDKIYHFVEYFGLGLVLVRALRVSGFTDPLKASFMAVAIGVGIAIGDEVFQSYVPGRSSSHLDALADAVGLIVSQLVYLWFARE